MVRKRSVRIVATLLLAVLMFGMLTGCGNNLNGTWTAGETRSFVFNGRNFTRTERVFRWPVGEVADITSGTFSISDGQIEFVFDSGRVSVYSFSRTENTISIGGRRFTRQ